MRTNRGAGLDDAEADQVLADAAGQFPAQGAVGAHQQRGSTSSFKSLVRNLAAARF